MRDIDATKIRRLDGGLLLIFRELLRRRRASEVAVALGLSQPAVSHALARLRDLFDDTLFIRRPHGLEPTRRALQLAPQIEALVELADQTLKKDSRFDPRVSSRRFLMAAPDFVAAHIGPWLLQQLGKLAPGAGVDISAMTNDAAISAVKKGEIDLALGRFGAAEAGVKLELLYEDRYCVVVRKGHPAFRRSISLKQYLEAGHIFSRAPGEGGEEDDVASAARLRVTAVVPRWLTVLVLVSQSDGIGTVPRRLAERHAGLLGLAILDAPFVGKVLKVSAAMRTGETDAGAAWLWGQVQAAARGKGKPKAADTTRTRA